MSLTFGVSGSSEEAIARVRRRLRGDHRFVSKWAGGTFYALPTHIGVHVPKSPDDRINFYGI